MFRPILSCMVTMSLAFALSFFSASASAAPQVVVSIKPLHSLVSAVMEGVATPGLIVKGAGSEHGYALKPSDAEMLSHADIIFIADPHMEGFLQKPIESLSAGKQLVILSQTPHLNLLQLREGGSFEADDHEGEGHQHGAMDFHFWLDPDNAKKLVSYIADILAKNDTEHAQSYKNNAIAYSARLDQLADNIQNKVESVRGKNFIVFHDAYHYFEKRFDVTAVGSVSVDPERQPGAKRLSAIRQLIIDKNVVCVFTEPQFPNKLVNVIIENTPAKTDTLDPLGMALDASPDLYPQLMTNLADHLVRCLSD